MIDQDEVGYIGARFGSPSMRKRLKEADQPDLPDFTTTSGRKRVDIGRTGARFGSPALRKRLIGNEEVGNEEVTEQEVPEPPPPVEEEPVWPEYQPEYQDVGHSLIRPYTRTGGRTAASYDLRLETLISAEDHQLAMATPEHRAIVQMCVLPRSVAEIAALMAVPLGVARVLLSDLIAIGLVAVHEEKVAADLTLMERVLAGLRNL